MFSRLLGGVQTSSKNDGMIIRRFLRLRQVMVAIDVRFRVIELEIDGVAVVVEDEPCWLRDPSVRNLVWRKRRGCGRRGACLEAGNEEGAVVHGVVLDEGPSLSDAAPRQAGIRRRNVPVFAGHLGRAREHDDALVGASLQKANDERFIFFFEDENVIWLAFRRIEIVAPYLELS